MNNSTPCPSYQFSPSFIVLASLSGVSAFFSAVGNFVVLWTIYKTVSLHCESNLFICSLASADLVVGLVLNPLLIVRAVVYSYQRYVNPDYSSHGFDEAEDFLWIQGLLISTFSFTAISIDRFTAITMVFHYKTMVTKRRCQIIIVFLWVCSSSVAFCRIFLNDKNLPILWLAIIILACVIPFLITCFCYNKIFKAVKLQVKKIVSPSSIEEREEQKEALKNTKTAFTIAIVIGVFALSYFPSVVIACVNLVIKDKCSILFNGTIEWPWACFVAYLSSAINPWIYSLRSREFRKAIKRAFSCTT